MSIQQIFHRALQHHQAHEPAQARRSCREVLVQQPSHPDALHLLGILMAQSGKLDEAVDLIRQAIAGRPDFAQAWQNLGCVLINAARYDEALDAYEHLAKLRPQEAMPHYVQGLVLRDLGRPEEAVDAFRQAWECSPDLPGLAVKLGMLLRSQGRQSEAIAIYRAAIARSPEMAELHNNLANALRDQGDLEQALDHYRLAVQIKPQDATSHLNLANALADAKRYSDAVLSYQDALRRQADLVEGHSRLGFALANLRRFEEAEASHGRAMTLTPDDPAVHEALGATLLLKHDIVAAGRSFRRALQLGPRTGQKWNGLGLSLRALGHFDESAESFRRALELEPGNAVYHLNQMTVGTDPDPGSAIRRLSDLWERPNLRADERVNLGFALGKVLDEADRFDEAFTVYSRANELFRQSWPAGEQFDGDRLRNRVDRLIAHYTPAFFHERRQWGQTSELPVFIVGMARSGTSLLEQIAASHPAVFGAGELMEIDRLSRQLARGGDPGLGTRWRPEATRSASARHLDYLASLAPPGGAERVVDKMPGNVFLLGLVAVLFPGARVIFCRRDARDTCLSCYFQHFGGDRRLRHTYDLNHCASQHVETDRLIDHWLRTLPLTMLEVHYEALVDSQEAQTRRLLEFLGLPWDPACLDFHLTQRVVTTASAWQVRQPLYARSLGRWKNYQRHLDPLLKSLEGGPARPGEAEPTAGGKH